MKMPQRLFKCNKVWCSKVGHQITLLGDWGLFGVPKNKAPRHGMASDPEELTWVLRGFQTESLMPYNTHNRIRDILPTRHQTTDFWHPTEGTHEIRWCSQIKNMEQQCQTNEKPRKTIVCEQNS